MKTRPLGNTGLEVGAIGLGGVPLSCTRKRPTERDAIGVIQHAIECGVSLIDTADSYCLDESEYHHNERLIGKALAGLPRSERDEIVVATKAGWIRPQGSWIPCGRPKHLRRQCEGALLALQVERIFLYQHHTPDPDVPLEDSVGELTRFQEEGKIQFIGVSNYSVEQLDIAQSMTEIASVQNQYALDYREPEEDGVLEATRTRGLAFLPWSPLGGLGGAKQLGDDNDGLRRVAKDRGVSVHRIALAWLLSRGPHVLPIPGASRKESIEDSAQAADIELSSEELERIEHSSGNH